MITNEQAQRLSAIMDGALISLERVRYAIRTVNDDTYTASMCDAARERTATIVDAFDEHTDRACWAICDDIHATVNAALWGATKPEHTTEQRVESIQHWFDHITAQYELLRMLTA